MNLLTVAGNAALLGAAFLLLRLFYFRTTVFAGAAAVVAVAVVLIAVRWLLAQLGWHSAGLGGVQWGPEGWVMLPIAVTIEELAKFGAYAASFPAHSETPDHSRRRPGSVTHGVGVTLSFALCESLLLVALPSLDLLRRLAGTAALHAATGVLYGITDLTFTFGPARTAIRLAGLGIAIFVHIAYNAVVVGRLAELFFT